MPLLTNAQTTVTAAPGTGKALLGAATSGAQTWAAAGAADGVSYSYRIEGAAGWEDGTSVYASADNSITRTPQASSAAGNAAVNFGADAVVSQVLMPGDVLTDTVTVTTTPTASSGAVLNVSCVCRYRRVGAKLIWANFDVYVANNGTGAGSLILALPVQANGNNNTQNMVGRENAATGKILQGFINGSLPNQMTVVFGDNSYPGANGYRLQLTGVYEAA